MSAFQDNSSGSKRREPTWLEDMIARSLAGDKEAFGILYKEFSPDLGRYLHTYGGDKGIAQDLVQDTFIQSWLQLGTLDKPSSFKSWLYRIGKNKAIDRYRKEGKKKIISLEREQKQIGQITLLVNQSDPRGSRDPGEYIPLMEYQMELVVQALEVLDPIRRECFLLRTIGDFSYDEIADFVEIKPSSARTYTSEAKQLFLAEYNRLKQELDNDESGR